MVMWLFGSATKYASTGRECAPVHAKHTIIQSAKTHPAGGLVSPAVRRVRRVSGVDFDCRLAERQISIELSERAKEYFVQTGYDPTYGARPLERLLQKEIETHLGR